LTNFVELESDVFVTVC